MGQTETPPPPSPPSKWIEKRRRRRKDGREKERESFGPSSKNASLARKKDGCCHPFPPSSSFSWQKAAFQKGTFVIVPPFCSPSPSPSDILACMLVSWKPKTWPAKERSFHFLKAHFCLKANVHTSYGFNGCFGESLSFYPSLFMTTVHTWPFVLQAIPSSCENASYPPPLFHQRKGGALYVEEGGRRG